MPVSGKAPWSQAAPSKPSPDKRTPSDILTLAAQATTQAEGLVFHRRVKITADARRDIDCRKHGDLVVLVHPTAIQSWHLPTLLRRIVLVSHDIDCTSTNASAVLSGEHHG